ncbi:MAG: class I SAM-dependent methyltransferase [Planctomycetota bacterium]
MPDYRAIYNHTVEQDARYNLAENSPGLRAVVQATDRLSRISGRYLDVGCGVGFAAQYLSGPFFDANVFGVDVSDSAIDKAKQRMADVPGASQRFHAVENGSLPFDDHFFNLVICFDVLEHLDLVDIDQLLSEVDRVLAKGGTFYGSVSCRHSGVTDPNGDNLHRTVESPGWWIDRLSPDSAEWDGHRQQIAFWIHKPLFTSNQLRLRSSERAELKDAA